MEERREKGGETGERREGDGREWDKRRRRGRRRKGSGRRKGGGRGWGEKEERKMNWKRKVEFGEKEISTRRGENEVVGREERAWEG